MSDISDAIKIPFKLQLGNTLFEGKVHPSFLEAPVRAVKLCFPEDKESGLLELTSVDLEERARWLEEMLVLGYCERTVVLGDKLKVVLRSRSMQSALDADVIPKGHTMPDGANNRWAANYDTVRTLASIVTEWNGKKPWAEPDPTVPQSVGADTLETRERFMRRQAEPIISYLADAYNTFLADMRTLLRPRVIDAIVSKS